MCIYSFSLLCVVTFHYWCILSSTALFLIDFPPHPKPSPSPPSSAPNPTQPSTAAFTVPVGSPVEPSSHSRICGLALQQHVLFQHPAVSNRSHFGLLRQQLPHLKLYLYFEAVTNENSANWPRNPYK